MSSRKPIIIVSGGQWGSEAKGAISAYLVASRNVRYAVRTGAVNAGHTMYYDSRPYVFQQLPCAFHNPNTIMVLGAGSMIHPDVLVAELDALDRTGVDVYRRLVVDFRAGLHLPFHTNLAADAGRHHKMGATGKGCSEAITAKIRDRGNPNPLLFKSWLEQWGEGPSHNRLIGRIRFGDTEHLLNAAYDAGEQILLEGTQGTLLDLHLGPYPYTTHKQSIAGQWATECGLSPSLDYEVVSVCRTYPIRVAGNSGPMPNEISWPTLARRINLKLTSRGFEPMVAESALCEFEDACLDIGRNKYGLRGVDFHRWNQMELVNNRVAVSELHRDALNAIGADSLTQLKRLFEMTTVTKKLRRLADFDTPTMRNSMRQNRPAYVILTFLNYEFPYFWNESQADVVMADTSVREYLAALEAAWGVPIKFVTTGPQSCHVLDTKHGRQKADAAGKRYPAPEEITDMQLGDDDPGDCHKAKGDESIFGFR